ncbi:hypothetical protein AbraIFM66951_005483 [Aspergillus brasiliensis]|nr:hypothetical protein AbraIFM66951_005483 [Aspergillus brasiliensis]
MMTIHENFPRWNAQLGMQAITQSLRKQTALFPRWQLRKQPVALPKLILAGNTTGRSPFSRYAPGPVSTGYQKGHESHVSVRLLDR